MTTENIPKIILHLHLDGSLDLDLAVKWLHEDGYNYTKKQVKKLLSVDKDCHNLNDYLTKFTIPCKLLTTEERLEEATYTLLKKLASENVVYAEIRFAPLKHQAKGLTKDDVIKAVIKGKDKATTDYNIDCSLILCCMRDSSIEDNLQVVSLAKKYQTAIDLAGAESIYKTKDFKYIFDYAKKENIPYTIHAGEASGKDSINSALDFGTKRLGHGIKCIEDKETLERIKKEKVLLEICLTSNYQTEAIKGKHPLEELYNQGINISINTDNDTVSNINITEEYKRILKETNLTIKDLIKCNYNSIDYLFTSNEIKDKLKSIYQNINSQ